MPADCDIGLTIACDAWRRAVPVVESVCRNAVHAALAVGDEPAGAIEISLLLTNDSTIQGLNRDYRQQDRPTNVLSFPGPMMVGMNRSRPFDEAPPMLLGDVALALETVTGESQDQAKTISDHLSHLIVHGVLHLLGYDHDNDETAARMEGLEIEALARLRIANPYLPKLNTAAAV
jgi:probable rRNA maturation factor